MREITGSSPVSSASSEIPAIAQFPSYGENCAMVGISLLPPRPAVLGPRVEEFRAAQRVSPEAKPFVCAAWRAGQKAGL